MSFFGLAFQHPQPKSFWQKLIAWKTNSAFCHVELVFSDGKCFSASEYDKGTRFKNWNEQQTQAEWTTIPLNEISHLEPAIRAWSEKLIGVPYDWSEITSFIVNRPLDNPAELICSTASLLPLKLGAQVLADCKFPSLSPQDLYVAIVAWKSGLNYKSK